MAQTNKRTTDPAKASPDDPLNSLDDLKEKLAAIEHERWASWQAWLHSQLKKVPDGMLMTPEYYQHLEEQIAADYSELSDREKASDMEQVDRYWPIILELIQEAERKARLDEIENAVQQFILTTKRNPNNFSEYATYRIKELESARENLSPTPVEATQKEVI